MAGLTDAGFVAKTQAEVLADEKAAIANATALGANVNVEVESPLGQIANILAAMLAELWAEGENIQLGGSILTAAGAQLVSIAANYGLTPHPAVASTVVIDLGGTGGTTIPATSALTDPEGNRWTIDSVALLRSFGTEQATFRCDTTGPIAALAGTTWTIATPVSGWTSAENLTDATLGRSVETDPELRNRCLSAARGGAASGTDGIRARVLAVEDVTECLVIENDTSDPDADGRPGHSIEVVVRGGTDADVLAAVFTKGAGIQTVTTVEVSNQITGSVVDASGTSQTVNASRPDLIPIYVEVDYTPLPSAPTNVVALITQAIIDFGGGLTLDTPGVYPPNVEAAIFRAFAGSVFSSFDLRMGLSPSPVGAVTVPTSRTEIAEFDSSRITVTRV